MLSREELIEELVSLIVMKEANRLFQERRDQEIRELTAELSKYRSYFHGRKIAVSAETPHGLNNAPVPFHKDQQ